MNSIIVSDYSEYLERKLKGEDVVNYYEKLGFSLCPIAKTDFGVMSLSKTDMVICIYHILSDNKFSIEIPKSYNHNLAKVIYKQLTSDPRTIEWWKMFFFERYDGTIKYDPFYDPFPISNNDSTTCSKFIKQIDTALQECEIPNLQIFIDGEWKSCNALKYVLQHATKSVQELPNDILAQSNYTFQIARANNEKTMLLTRMYAPDSIGNAFDSFFKYPIHLPLDRLDAPAIDPHPWSEILPDTEPDYYISDPSQAIKIIRLSANYDAFGNIFLTATTTKNKQKTILM